MLLSEQCANAKEIVKLIEDEIEKSKDSDYSFKDASIKINENYTVNSINISNDFNGNIHITINGSRNKFPGSSMKLLHFYNILKSFYSIFDDDANVYVSLVKESYENIESICIMPELKNKVKDIYEEYENMPEVEEEENV